MADAPWRCTQCGTVNEPNANACRSCGRWPSLFDLERDTIEEPPAMPEDTFAREAPEPLEAPVLEETGEPVETDYSGVPAPKEVEWRGPEDPLDRPLEGWPRIARWLVPLAFVAYIVISAIVNR